MGGRVADRLNQKTRVRVGVVLEHAVRDVEDLRHDELEELLLHAPLVDAVLAQELNL